MDTLESDDTTTPLLEEDTHPPPELEPVKKTTNNVEVPCCETELEKFLNETPLPRGIQTREEFQELLESSFLWWGAGSDFKVVIKLTITSCALFFAFISTLILQGNIATMGFAPMSAFFALLIASVCYVLYAIVQRTRHKYQQQEQDKSSTRRSPKSELYLFGHTILELVFYLVAIQACTFYDQVTGEWVLRGLRWCRETAMATTGHSSILAGFTQAAFVLTRVLVHYLRAVFGMIIFIRFYLPVQAISYNIHRHWEIPGLRDCLCLLLHIPPCLLGLHSATFKLIEVAGDELYFYSLFGLAFILVGIVFIPTVAMYLLPKKDREAFGAFVLLVATTKKEAAESERGADMVKPSSKEIDDHTAAVSERYRGKLMLSGRKGTSLSAV